MKKKHVERLHLLANFLDTLPRQRFDYSRWVGEDWKGNPNYSCGTNACALGWACAMPEFKHLLKMDYKLQEESTITGPGVPVHIPTGLRNFSAATNAFGLDMEEAEYLFAPEEDPPAGLNEIFDYDLPTSPGNKATPKQVAKHIRMFLAVKAWVAAKPRVPTSY